MKLKMVRKNQFCVNMADGNMLQVVEKIADNQWKLAVLDENKLPTDVEQILDDNNSEVYRFVSDPNPISEPEGEYSVSDGMLMCDGKPATYSMGSLVAVEILGKIKGAVVFLCDDGDGLSVYGFNPYLDPLGEAAFVKYADEVEHAVLLASEHCNLLVTVTVEEKEAENVLLLTDPVEQVKDSRVFLIDRKAAYDMECIPFIPNEDDIQIVGNCTFFGGEVLDVDDEMQIHDRHYGYIMVNKGHLVGLPILSDKAIIKRSHKYGLTFLGENSLMYFGRSSCNDIQTPLLGQLSAFPYLVNVTEEGDVVRYTFTDNAERPTVRHLVEKHTADRGTVYTID